MAKIMLPKKMGGKPWYRASSGLPPKMVTICKGKSAAVAQHSK